jgi:hypothetical protein
MIDFTPTGLLFQTDYSFYQDATPMGLKENISSVHPEYQECNLKVTALQP